jgi:L-ascorbate metabolism protein UlaG (beta-lactamase superfamily)
MLDAFTWYKQAALKWQGKNLTVHIDPWGVPDGEPKADLILITHAHFDHYSQEDIDRVTKEEGTIFVAPHDVAAECLTTGDIRAIKPGETLEAAGLQIHAVPAYNVRPERLEMHPRDNNWVGYVLDLGEHRYYLAGDTDHIPEMAEIGTDVAFVPAGGTYTMDVQEAVGAIKEIRPKLAVPYHFGFVVGPRSTGDEFVKAIAPIEGRVLEPVNPFEQP